MNGDNKLEVQRDNLRRLVQRGEALIAAGPDARPEGMTAMQFTAAAFDLGVMQQHLAEIEATIAAQAANPQEQSA